MRCLVGGALVASPLVVLTIFMVRDIGWLLALAVWAAVAVTVGVIAVGIQLLVGDGR